MDVDIRSIGPEQFEDYRVAVHAGFGGDARPEEFEHDRAITELDRTLAAFDGSQVVGTAGAFSYELTVPGALLPAAGVTAVSVLPTHRRRGILRRMMRHQLDDVRERGEPLAILWASESVIYGRFGYGMAAQGMRFVIERNYTRLAHELDSPGRVRLISREEALKAWPPVWDRVRAERPGMVNRSAEWWEHETLHDPEHHRDGYTSNRHAVYEEEGEALGYARYRIKHAWEGGFSTSELLVGELMATDLASYAGLWRYLFGVDLIFKVEARRRPLDEPLLWMLADPRRMKRHHSDSLWVRVVDVPAALGGRRYSRPGLLVLEVRDSFCPWNEGRYLLEGGPEGAQCRPTQDEPDLTLGAADLGAVYLGGASLLTLQQAGRVQGERLALRTADQMFAWDVEPWSPEAF